MKTPHPYADILRAIADGETIQWTPGGNTWVNVDTSESFEFNYSPDRYRIKPHTIRIGDVDVPEPMREAPAVGEDYFMPKIEADFWVEGPLSWCDDTADKRWLERGLCYSNKADAEIASRAIAALFTKN